jgi:hypothetical protein
MKESVSPNVVDSGQNLKGFLNWRQTLNVIIAALGFATATDLFAAVVKALFDNVDKIYIGPNASYVAYFLGLLASYFGTRKIAAKMRDDGKPILFSQDEDDG